MTTIEELLHSLNWGAVAVAAVSFFILGAIWYNILAKPWMAAVGKTEEELKAAPKTAYLYTLLLELVMVIVLAGLINLVHLSSVKGAITFGVITGAAFSGCTAAINNMYGLRPFSLTVIDSAYMVLGYTISSIILTLWK